MRTKDEIILIPVISLFFFFFQFNFSYLFFFLSFFLSFFFFLDAPRGIWDHSSLTKDRTHFPCSQSAES